AEQVDDADDDEAEVDQPLDDPLHVLVERLRRLQVEEADHVDEQEAREEEEEHRRGARDTPVRRPPEPVDRPDPEEAERGNVRERDLAEKFPGPLPEGRAEDRAQEEKLDERALADSRAYRPHSSSPSSSPRASRESSCRCSRLK